MVTIASTPCTLLNPTNLLENMWQFTCAKTPDRSTSTISMSSPVLSQPFGTYTMRGVSRPRPRGSRPSAGAIISPGRSSTSKMLQNSSRCPRRLKRDICAANIEESAPRKLLNPPKTCPLLCPTRTRTTYSHHQPQGEIPHVRQPNRLVPGRLEPGQQVCHDPTPRR